LKLVKLTRGGRNRCAVAAGLGWAGFGGALAPPEELDIVISSARKHRLC
jgi:hypothetical protein